MPDAAADTVHVCWCSLEPLSASWVRQVRALKRSGKRVKLWLPDDVLLTVGKSSAQAVTLEDWMTFTQQVEQVEGGTVLLSTTTSQSGAAVAVYTVDRLLASPLYTKMEYVNYPRYVITGSATQTILEGWTVVRHLASVGERGTDEQWTVTYPGIVPVLQNHEFVLYVASGSLPDLSMLNRAVVNMLHDDAYVAVMNHSNSFPHIREVVNHHMHESERARVSPYIQWRLQEYSGGGDDAAGNDVFDTSLVLRDMQHSQMPLFSTTWTRESQLCQNLAVSLFFVQQMGHAISRLPDDMDTSRATLYMTKLCIMPQHLPTNTTSLVPPLIPRALHMIWLGNSMPASCQEYVNTWTRLMPTWTVKLWRDQDLDSVPPRIKARIDAAHKGAQKADILRAYIIDEFGGFYLDADVMPHRSLEPLVALGEPLILCHDLPLTWPYMASAFFGAVPHHPVMHTLCEYLLSDKVQLNTPDIHMQTGPRALGHAMHTAPNLSGRKYYLLPIRAFYYNSNAADKFGTHVYAHTWK